MAIVDSIPEVLFSFSLTRLTARESDAYDLIHASFLPRLLDLSPSFFFSLSFPELPYCAGAAGEIKKKELGFWWTKVAASFPNLFLMPKLASVSIPIHEIV